jgi:alpha-aminoadipic semialdehyde synthase
MLRESSSGMPPLPKDPMTPLDIFAYLLAHKLKYAPHERDMVVLSHEIITQAARAKEPEKASNDDRSGFSYGKKRPPTVMPATVHTSTLIAYGTKVPNVGFKGERPASAMARTVGIPIALAALLIADGTIRAGAGGWSGVQSPFLPFVYNPILDGLAKVGIQFAESTRSVQRVASTADLPSRMNSGTVEESLRRSSETRFLKYLEGIGKKAPGGKPMPFHVHDLDADRRWKEDEVVEWGWKSLR